MAHHAARSAYQRLADRLNRFPQGAPPSQVLFAILKLLFSEREAGLVAQLPIRPFTPAVAAERWGVPEAEARRTLEELASSAVLLDMEDDAGSQTYVLPPPMAGFFEFSMMRVRGDLDQRLLAELFTSTSTWRRISSVAVPRRRDADGPGLRPGTGAAGRRGPAPARARPRARHARSIRTATHAAWACATAGTRWSMWAGHATRQWTSA